jgi:hypothetical protein
MAYLLAPRKITGKQALTNEQNGTTSRELFQRLQGELVNHYERYDTSLRIVS